MTEGDKIFISCLEACTSNAQSLPDSSVSKHVKQGLQLLKSTLYKVKPHSYALRPREQLKVSFLDSFRQSKTEENLISKLESLVIDLETAVLMTDDCFYLSDQIYKATEHFQLAKEILEF